MPVTTRPQRGDVTAVKRLTGLRWVLLGLQQKYLAEEGINHRGKQFEHLVNAVGAFRSDRISEIEMLDLLGAPDYAVFDQEGGDYAYVYSRSAEKDSVAYVRVSRLGFVDQVGYGVYKPEYFAATPKLKLWPEQKFPRIQPRTPRHIAAPGPTTQASDDRADDSEDRGGYLGIQVIWFSTHKDPRIPGGIAPPRFGGPTGIDPSGMIPCVEVADVLPGSPASRADLRAGDLIIAIGDKPVPEFTDDGIRFGDVEAFTKRIRATRPETVLTLSVRRGSEGLKIPVTVGRVPDKPYFGLQWVSAKAENGGFIVKVSEVEPGSPAERAELRPGDLIDAIGGYMVGPENFTREALRHPPGEPVTFVIFRAGKISGMDTRTVTLIPTTRPTPTTAPQE